MIRSYITGCSKKICSESAVVPKLRHLYSLWVLKKEEQSSDNKVFNLIWFKFWGHTTFGKKLLFNIIGIVEDPRTVTFCSSLFWRILKIQIVVIFFKTCEASAADENSSFIFTVRFKSVPLYHFKIVLCTTYGFQRIFPNPLLKREK